MVLPTSYNQEPPSRDVNHGQRRDIPGGLFTYWNRVELRHWVLELYSRDTKEGTMRALAIADCINETCPWSGKPVQAGSLTEYDGHVVGFCNPGCRDKFESAVQLIAVDRRFKDLRGFSQAPARRVGPVIRAVLADPFDMLSRPMFPKLARLPGC